MAASFEKAGAASDNTGVGVSFAISPNLAGGARVAIGFACLRDTTDAIANFDIDGTSLNFIDARTNGVSERLEVWYLEDATDMLLGAHTVNCSSFSGSNIAVGLMTIVSVTLGGVYNVVWNFGTSAGPAKNIESNTTDLAVSCVGAVQNTVTQNANSPLTRRFDTKSGTSGLDISCSGGTMTGKGSSNLNWSLGASKAWTQASMTILGNNTHRYHVEGTPGRINATPAHVNITPAHVGTPSHISSP